MHAHTHTSHTYTLPEERPPEVLTSGLSSIWIQLTDFSKGQSKHHDPDKMSLASGNIIRALKVTWIPPPMFYKNI